MTELTPAGNHRLTTSVGLVLLVLLGVEALTTLALDTYLSVHIFLGLLLLPPVALKLASTGCDRSSVPPAQLKPGADS